MSRYYSIIAILFLLQGCSDSDSKKTTDIKYNGIWVAQSYGKAMQIKAEKLITYEFTSSFCYQSASKPFSKELAEEEFWQISENNEQLFQHITKFGVNYRSPIYKKDKSLPDTCNELRTPENTTAQTEYQWFIELFDQYYPTFTERNIDWMAITSQFNSLIEADDDFDGLMNAMSQSIAPLRDSHVAIRQEEQEVNYINTEHVLDYQLAAEFIQENGDIDSDEKYESMISYVEAQMEIVNDIKLEYASGNTVSSAFNEGIIWFVTSNNIGILIINGMSGEEDDNGESNEINDITTLAQVMPNIMGNIKNTNGLIIDVRNNPGGNDTFSQYIARYFLDNDRELYKKQYRQGSGRSTATIYSLKAVENPYLKPIALLTSGGTESAAEVFTLMLRELPHVTLAGQKTQGALSDVLSKSLPSGIEIDLVNEYYTSMDNELFEASGIPVEIAIPYGSKENRAKGQDEAYEHFIKKFSQL